MASNAQFLLINGTGDQAWYQLLTEVSAPLGNFRAANEKEALELIIKVRFELIIIDATMIKHVPLLTSRIRALQPGAKVVAVTASPTWRRAREAFNAGATDYILKTYDRVELSCALLSALKKTVPPWPR